jgi:putative membrane protein
MRNVLVWSILLALCWTIGCRQHIATPKNKEDVSPKEVKKAAQAFTSESDFLQRTAQAMRAEAEIGQLAQSKAQSPDVKTYAEKVVKDYTKMSDDLQSLAQKQGVTLPGGLDDQHQELKVKLQSKSGTDFDKTYMRAEVVGQEGMINLVEGTIQKGETPIVRDFATVNLITMRDHLDQARAIAKKIGA